MQVQKINDNKMKVILSYSDLLKKNIAIESFLSNSEETQNFFFEILDMIEEEYNFDIGNKKAIVEAFSLDNNVFVLNITKIENDLVKDVSVLNTSAYVFTSLKNLFDFYYFMIKKNLDFKNLYIYTFSNLFYVFLEQPEDMINNILVEFSSYRVSNNIENVILEHGKRVNLF
jgi:hypothetical protein